jgi:hypothetical protein
MTALGKILVFLVLVLSLAFNALVVNAYVARTNWKNASEKSAKSAADAAASANSMKTLLDETVAANEDAKRVLREERDRLYNQVVVLQAEVNRLDDANKQQLAAATRLNGQIDVLQANINRLTKQVDDYDKLLAAKELQINQLTAQANASKVAENKAKLDAAAERQRAEQFAQRIQDLQDQLDRALRQGRGDRGTPLPPNFRGTVESYDRSSGLITLTPGLDAGVAKGARMSVFRLAGGGKFLGTLEVLTSDPKNAVGRFTSANPRNLQPTPDDLPRKGDELKAIDQ